MLILGKLSIPAALGAGLGYVIGGPAAAIEAAKVFFMFGTKVVAVEKLDAAADKALDGLDQAKNIILKSLAKTVNIAGNALTGAYIASYLPSGAFGFANWYAQNCPEDFGSASLHCRAISLGACSFVVLSTVSGVQTLLFVKFLYDKATGEAQKP